MTESESPLAEFTGKARHNLEGPFPVCIELLDSLLLTLSDGLDDSPHDTSGRLYHLAYSSWRGAVLLSQIGAASQVPICLRHAIETLAYCYLLARDKTWEKIWWDRETDPAAKKSMRGSSGPLPSAKALMRAENAALSKRLTETLDHFIDFGAHPNVFQLVNATSYGVVSRTQTYLTAFLGDNDSRDRAFISCFGAGLMVSDFFELIWPVRFCKLNGVANREEVNGQGTLFINSVWSRQHESKP